MYNPGHNSYGNPLPHLCILELCLFDSTVIHHRGGGGGGTGCRRGRGRLDHFHNIDKGYPQYNDREVGSMDILSVN